MLGKAGMAKSVMEGWSQHKSRGWKKCNRSVWECNGSMECIGRKQRCITGKRWTRNCTGGMVQWKWLFEYDLDVLKCADLYSYRAVAEQLQNCRQCGIRCLEVIQYQKK